MADSRAKDYIGNYNFQVEIDGITQGFFQAVDGLEAQVEVVEYQSGDDLTLRKRPGRSKYSNVVLKRGYVDNDELWQWCKAALDGSVQRKNGSIILCDDAGEPVVRYNFFHAWPCRWKGMELDGKGNDALLEELELVVERIDRE